jgi:hypothetical protein
MNDDERSRAISKCIKEGKSKTTCRTKFPREKNEKKSSMPDLGKFKDMNLPDMPKGLPWFLNPFGIVGQFIFISLAAIFFGGGIYWFTFIIGAIPLLVLLIPGAQALHVVPLYGKVRNIGIQMMITTLVSFILVWGFKSLSLGVII